MTDLATLAAWVAASVYEALVDVAPANFRLLPLLWHFIVDSCCMEIAPPSFHHRCCSIFCRVSAPRASDIYGRQYFVRLFIRFFVCWLVGSKTIWAPGRGCTCKLAACGCQGSLKCTPQRKKDKDVESKAKKSKQYAYPAKDAGKDIIFCEMKRECVCANGGNRACNKR